MLRIDECAFFASHMKPSEAYLAGPNQADAVSATSDNSCMGEKDGDFFSFQLQDTLTDCGTVMSTNVSHFTYSNAIQWDENIFDSYVITRKARYIVRFACTFPREIIKSAGGVMTSLAHVELELNDEEGEFDVEMGLYEDDLFLTPVESTYEITVPEPINIALKMDTTNPKMKLQLKRCWATPE